MVSSCFFALSGDTDRLDNINTVLQFCLYILHFIETFTSKLIKQTSSRLCRHHLRTREHCSLLYSACVSVGWLFKMGQMPFSSNINVLRMNMVALSQNRHELSCANINIKKTKEKKRKQKNLANQMERHTHYLLDCLISIVFFLFKCSFKELLKSK